MDELRLRRGDWIQVSTLSPSQLLTGRVLGSDQYGIEMRCSLESYIERNDAWVRDLFVPWCKVVLVQRFRPPDEWTMPGTAAYPIWRLEGEEAQHGG